MNIKILFFIFLLFGRSNAKFPRKTPLKRRINYGFKLFYKNQKQLIDETKVDVSEKVIELVKDDIINDIIYYAKLYNMINDDSKSYLYIFMYEFIGIMRRNDNNPKISIPLYMSNVMAYIILKIIILNKLIHHT